MICGCQVHFPSYKEEIYKNRKKNPAGVFCIHIFLYLLYLNCKVINEFKWSLTKLTTRRDCGQMMCKWYLCICQIPHAWGYGAYVPVWQEEWALCVGRLVAFHFPSFPFIFTVSDTQPPHSDAVVNSLLCLRNTSSISHRAQQVIQAIWWKTNVPKFYSTMIIHQCC